MDCCCNHGADHVHDHTETEVDDGKVVVIDPGESRIPMREDVEVEVVGGTLDPAEQAAYAAYARQKEGSRLKKLVIHIEGEEVKLEYRLKQDGFERIRRITGGPTV